MYSRFVGHNYKKVSLLEAYNAVHHCDLICVSETYLDSSISNDEKDTQSRDSV